MNIETKKLFDLQSDILSNHILLKLLQFFASEKKEAYLYDTIIPTKEITKKELTLAEKNVPNTFNYSVNISINRPIVSFTLECEGFTPIEFYYVKLTQQKPTVNFLSSITQILMKLCKPRPSKIDNRFQKISQKYIWYFRYYECYSIWNDGLSTRLMKVKEPQTKINDLEKQLVALVSEIKTEYQAFTKLLIDMYNKENNSAYLNAEKTYEVSTSISKTRGISLRIKCIFGGNSERKVIPLSEFHPTNPVFKKDPLVSKEFISCIIPYLTKN